MALSSSRFCRRCAICYGWTEIGKCQAPCLVMKLYNQSLLDLLQLHGEFFSIPHGSHSSQELQQLWSSKKVQVVVGVGVMRVKATW